jgi:hypothetical protein
LFRLAVCIHQGVLDQFVEPRFAQSKRLARAFSFYSLCTHAISLFDPDAIAQGAGESGAEVACSTTYPILP